MSTVADALGAARPAIERISAEVWDLCELSLAEHESAKVHGRELEAAGFEVATGTAGVETAFLAERRFGDGPVVGFLSEYDALPGLGNEAIPRQQPREAEGAKVYMARDGLFEGVDAASTGTPGRSQPS